MSTPDLSERNAEVVRRYLRTFITRDLAELRAVVAGDVEIYGAGRFVRGRHNVEAAVMTPGLAAWRHGSGRKRARGQAPSRPVRSA